MLRFPKAFLSFILLIACAPWLHATAQVGDVLILEGKKYSIETNPLRQYLETHPEALPKREVFSTANWRGYIATWEAKNGALFLKDVEIERLVEKNGSKEFEYHSVMQTMFPGKSEVVADWYSGNIIVVTGKRTKYVHMGYASIYSSYLVLHIDKGGLLSQEKMDQKQFTLFRDRQFKAFQQTEEFRSRLAEAMAEKDAGSREEEINFMKDFFSEQYLSTIYAPE